MLTATLTGEPALYSLRQALIGSRPTEPVGPEPERITPHVVRLDLPTLRVRE